MTMKARSNECLKTLKMNFRNIKSRPLWRSENVIYWYDYISCISGIRNKHACVNICTYVTNVTILVNKCLTL